MTVAGSQRRADYAEETRRAIIAAARSLFADHGYFATRVEDIARSARVAPKTVYGVVGGKQGLLRILVDQWLDTPLVPEGLARMVDLPDARAVLALLGASVRSIHQDHGDVVQLLLAAAPHDATAAEGLAQSATRIRSGLREVAEHIAARGELADGIGVQRAVDVLYFYLGLRGFPLLVHDNGWSFEDAELWLVQQSTSALLRDPTAWSTGPRTGPTPQRSSA